MDITSRHRLALCASRVALYTFQKQLCSFPRAVAHLNLEPAAPLRLNLELAAPLPSVGNLERASAHLNFEPAALLRLNLELAAPLRLNFEFLEQ